MSFDTRLAAGEAGAPANVHARAPCGSASTHRRTKSCTGASGLLRNTSAPPSPVGKPRSLPSLLAESELFRAAHDFPQLLDLLALLGNEQFRVVDNVDEQDVPDLKFHI
jgi:hypothetical protein